MGPQIVGRSAKQQFPDSKQIVPRNNFHGTQQL
jgi:hypothetical protein